MSNTSTIDNEIDLIYEIGGIRHIPRMWQRFLGTDFADLADHHFRVFWIAMVIAAHEKDVDTGKLAKMVLVHDIAESRTGDVDYIARQYNKQNEELAINDMLGGTLLADEFIALWQEYHDRSSIEAKICKDADNLDVDFELYERTATGNTLLSTWQNMRDTVTKEKAYTKTAKEIYKALKKSNPKNWHLKGRNRINTGDWKK